MKTTLKRLWGFIRRSMMRLEAEQTFALAAQTAFFWLLSIFPLMLFLVSWVSRWSLPLNWDELSYLIPRDARVLLGAITTERKTSGFFSALIAAAASAWSASVGVWWLMKGVYKAFHDKPIQGKAAVKGRLISLLLTISFAAATLLPAGLRLLMDWVWFIEPGRTPLETAAKGTRVLLSLGLSYLFIWPLYRFTPGLSLPPGKARRLALYAALCWLGLNGGIEIYFARIVRYSAVYGSIGAFMALALWLYAVSILILLGAELGKVPWPCKSGWLASPPSKPDGDSGTKQA